jgi:hypothetical protein
MGQSMILNISLGIFGEQHQVYQLLFQLCNRFGGREKKERGKPTGKRPQNPHEQRRKRFEPNENSVATMQSFPLRTRLGEKRDRPSKGIMDERKRITWTGRNIIVGDQRRRPISEWVLATRIFPCSV